MSHANETLRLAVQHHRAGDLRQAEQLYLQVLEHEPDNADAHHLLGMAALVQSQAARAVEHFQRAVQYNGQSAAFRHHLGMALAAAGHKQRAVEVLRQALAGQPHSAAICNDLAGALREVGQVAEAEACFREAIRLDPHMVEAHNNLGNLLMSQQQWEQALASLQTAVGLRPQAVEVQFNLGNCYQAQGRWSQAEAAYRRAIVLKPDMAEAINSLGRSLQGNGHLNEAIACFQRVIALQPDFAAAHYNWGTALVAQGRPDLAVARLRSAAALNPDSADVHYGLGTALQEMWQLDEAIAAYRRALDLRSDMVLAHNNLANIYQQQGKTAEAIDCYRAALGIDPRHGDCFCQTVAAAPHVADAYCNLATALHFEGDHEGALACFAKSLEVDPHSPETHYNRALLYLSQQRFDEGWADFAWRLKCKTYPVRRFEQPLWDGAPFPGRTLLVHAEQGFGDTLHFVRYLSVVRRLGGRVLFEAQPRLLPLLKCSGVERLIAEGSKTPPFDVCAPLLALPGLMHTTLADMPCDVPYLQADEPLVESWRQRLSRFEGVFKVGINWQGNRAYVYDRFRSIPLAEFAPLASVAGVSLVSLQKGEGSEQLAALADQWTIHDLGPQLDESNGAFMDTAAVMKNLDLVITSDTATAHLAGALGVPVWVGLSTAPDWRWFLDRDDSPWYPTMRLFRQTMRGDWSGVFARMAAELAALAGAC